MAASNVQLVITQGQTFTWGWSVSVDGEPIDSTWVGQGQIRATVENGMPLSSGELLHTFTVECQDSGAVVIGVDDETSTGWDWTKANYGIEITNADASIRMRVAQGKVKVSPEVVA